jgi:hypothetical protein
MDRYLNERKGEPEEQLHAGLLMRRNGNLKK